jgi:hypothetical protein
MFITFWCCDTGLAQSVEYQTMIRQANADLAAENTDRALEEGRKAIELDPSGWEGHLIAAGAFQAKKRYDESTDEFFKALDRAPESKKAGIRALLEKCMREKVTASAAGDQTAISAAKPEITVSQAEVVLWKSIENSANPDDLRAYLSRYPDGSFAPLALQRIAKLVAARETAKLAEANVEKEKERLLALRNTLSGTWMCVDPDQTKVYRRIAYSEPNLSFGYLLENDDFTARYQTDGVRRNVVDGLSEQCAWNAATLTCNIHVHDFLDDNDLDDRSTAIIIAAKGESFELRSEAVGDHRSKWNSSFSQTCADSGRSGAVNPREVGQDSV